MCKLMMAEIMESPHLLQNASFSTCRMRTEYPVLVPIEDLWLLDTRTVLCHESVGA